MVGRSAGENGDQGSDAMASTWVLDDRAAAERAAVLGVALTKVGIVSAVRVETRAQLHAARGSHTGTGA